MKDDVVELVDVPARWPKLGTFPKELRDELVKTYLQADRSANVRQSWHKILTLVATTCGSLAVLAAILQLPPPGKLTPFKLPEWAEAVVAILAFLAVACGIIVAFQKGWLLRRHKAERCRLLIYSWMTDPCTWTPGRGFPDASCRVELERIESIDEKKLEAWCEVMSDFQAPELRCEEIDPGLLADLIACYRELRLGTQIDYFKRRVKYHSFQNRLLRRVVPLCFLLSILAALAHFGYSWYVGETADLRLGVTLGFVAASLPVLGSAVRTYRSANEFARNRLRYTAVSTTLQRLDEGLGEVKEGQAPEKAFRHLWHAEKVMEEEHREWLRLMLEAEWYG